MNRAAGQVLLFAVLALAGGCSESADEATPRDVGASGDEGAALGTISGQVRDQATDRPLAGVWVSAGDFGATTDEGGGYVLGPLPSGPSKLHAYRRGFRAESSTVIVPDGGSAGGMVSLERAAAPCCRLTGSWSARFELDSAGLNSRPSARRLTGRMSFDAGSDAERIRESSGTAEVDFGPLLGDAAVARIEESRGLVFAGDSVAVTLIPSFGDWAIELLGRQRADTVRGTWHQRASCCGAYGTFVLVRE